MFQKRSRWAKLVFVAGLLAAVALVLMPRDAAATDYTKIAGAVDWEDDAEWTPAGGPPGPGDSIQLDSAGTVDLAQDEEFGTSGTESTWSGSGELDARTHTLTLSGNGTFTYSGTGLRLRQTGGGGSFVVTAGSTFKHDSATDLYYGYAASVFTNYGTVLVESSGDLKMWSGGNFVCKNNATVSTTTSGQGRLDADAAGELIFEPGSILDATAADGILYLVKASGAGRGSADGFIATGAGKIQFQSSGWSLISGSRGAGETVAIEVNDRPIIPAGGTIYNVTTNNGNTNGLHWSVSGNSTINTSSGNVTNLGVFTMSGSSGWMKPASVGGEFVNEVGATFRNLHYTVTYVDSATFRNRGTLQVHSPAYLEGLGASPRIIIEAGAVVERTIDGQGGIKGGSGQIHVHSGSIFIAASTGAIVEAFADASGSSFISNAVCSGAGIVDFGGDFGLIKCSREAGSTVTIALDDSPTVPASGMVFDVSDANGNTNGLLWRRNGNSSIITSSGNITNLGVFTMQGSAGWMKPSAGGGEFVNEVNGICRNNHYTTVYLEGTFRNRGAFEFLANTSFTLFSGSSTFINESGGMLRKTGGTASFSGSGGDDTFSNVGALQVDATSVDATLNINTTIASSPQFSGNTLSGGTWEVIAGTNTATLNFNLANAGITTIGAGADVMLSGANATFSELSSGALTVSGTFGVRDQMVYALTNLTVGGTLEFGLEAADEGGSLNTGIDVSGPVDFTGGTVNVTNLGDMVVGTYRIIEWTGAESGTLTLGTPDLGTLKVSLLQDNTGNFVELNVGPLHPPGTVMIVR